MSRTRRVIMEQALRAKYMPETLLTNANAVNKLNIAAANDFAEKVRSYTPGNPDIEVWRVGTDDLLRIGGESIKPARKTITFNLAANASLADQAFFIADRPYYVHAIREVHSTACGVAATLQIRKIANGTTTLTGGSALLSTAFALDGTANTVQNGTLSTDDTVLTLAEGDILTADFSATLTSLVGVVVTLVVSPAYSSHRARFVMNANGSLSDQCFYIASRPMTVVGAKCWFKVAGTNGSAVTLQITKDTSTDAPGAGTDLLTNNSDAGFNLKGTAGTIQEGTLTATAASLLLAAGDRLSVDFAGTLTSVAGLVVDVELAPVFDRVEVTFNMAANGSLGDEAFWIADRDYKILDVGEVHSVLGTDGGSVTLMVTVDRATDAPGAGTDVAASGFNLKSTVNTLQWLTLSAARTILIQAGDRLSVDFAGTLTSVAGVVVVVALQPI